jgi:hypothetical protein
LWVSGSRTTIVEPDGSELTMSWMNEYEIDEAIEILSRRKPEIAPYARFLGAWRDTVNQNSDGWAHWRAGSKCADRLSSLVKAAVEVARGFKGNDEMPRETLFRSALTPIKQMATKRGFAQPELGAPDEAPAPRM